MSRPNCPHCGSSWVNKAREVKNKYVTKQGYRCPECNRFFVERDGFVGKSYPKEVIVEAMHLYVEGLSLSKIRTHLDQHRGYSPSDGSILNWVREYSEVVENFEQEQMDDPKIGRKIHLDEVFLKVGNKMHYSMNAIDKKTKYNLNTKFIKSRTNENFNEYFEELKNTIGEQAREIYEKEKQKSPEDRNTVTFVTDRLQPYEYAFEKQLGHIADLDFGVPIACRKYGLEHNNNPIERHNEDIKQRYKIMRNFKSYESASAFLSLRRTIYNHVRPHQGLDHTPGEEAGIDLDLGRNRLLDLIETCASQK